MTDSNDESNANGNQDVTNQLTVQTNSNDASTSVQRATSIQTGPNARVNETHHITVHRSRLPTRSIGNGRHLRLGEAQPWSLDYIPILNQDEQGAARITHPFDEIWPLNISDVFSSSIEIFHPSPRESIGVEDTQQHDMPTPITLNNNRHELIMDNGNNRADVDARTHNSPGASTDVTIHNAPVNQAIIEDNIMTTAPVESLHDTDFSVDIADPHSINQSDADERKDENRLVAENFHTIACVNDLTHTSEGQASPNPSTASVDNKNVIWLNQTNTTIDQPIATNTSCPEALDDERNVNNPIGGVYQSRVHVTPPSNLFIPKIQTPIDSGDESSGESTA